LNHFIATILATAHLDDALLANADIFQSLGKLIASLVNVNDRSARERQFCVDSELLIVRSHLLAPVLVDLLALVL